VGGVCCVLSGAHDGGLSTWSGGAAETGRGGQGVCIAVNRKRAAGTHQRQQSQVTGSQPARPAAQSAASSQRAARKQTAVLAPKLRQTVFSGVGDCE
jgi:hypothetical protein